MNKMPLNNADKALLREYGLDWVDYKKAQHLLYDAGEYLSREGEALRNVYFVVSGRAKVMLGLSDGKQIILAYFISNGIIGDVELMTNVQTNQSTIQAVTDFECIALPIDEYKAKLKENNAFVNLVGKELAEKLKQRALNGAITTLQPLESRLCAYILQTATGGLFCEQLTEVALMVGASYRHLLRCLEKLCNDGILEKKARKYRIADREALMAMVGDLYVLY